MQEELGDMVQDRLCTTCSKIKTCSAKRQPQEDKKREDDPGQPGNQEADLAYNFKHDMLFCRQVCQVQPAEDEAQQHIHIENTCKVESTYVDAVVLSDLQNMCRMSQAFHTNKPSATRKLMLAIWSTSAVSMKVLTLIVCGYKYYGSLAFF